MHHVTDEQIIIALFIAVVGVCFAFLGGVLLGIWSTTKLPVKPVYTIKGMLDNYSKIEDEIKACKNKKELRDAYLSIFSFEALYADSPSFTSELYEKYEVKQKELLKQKEVLVKVH
jgi:hypothetical protein